METYLKVSSVFEMLSIFQTRTIIFAKSIVSSLTATYM